MTDPSFIFETKSDVRYRVVDREAVVVRQSELEVLTLNEVGTRVLELLDGNRTLKEVLDRLEGEFDVGRQTLERDVVVFLKSLVEAGVVAESGGAKDAE